MSKSKISFLAFAGLVLVVFVGSSIFANLGKDVDSPTDAPQPSSAQPQIQAQPKAQSPQPSTSQTSPSPQPTQTNPAPQASSGITMSDVQKHNGEASCWTVVNNSVYDLTSFISSHPGGSQAILSLCGIDGTSAFLDQHGSQRRPNNELSGFKIGDLAK